MSANYQEDYLIANIDLARQGFTPESLSNIHFELLEYASFYKRHTEVCFRIAEMSLGRTDQDILLQISGLAIRYAIEKRALRRCLAENGVTRQAAVALQKKDPVRIRVESKMEALRSLRKQQDGLKECLRSRQCLRDESELISLYLETRGIGASRLPKVMRWIKLHYPEQ